MYKSHNQVGTVGTQHGPCVVPLPSWANFMMIIKRKVDAEQVISSRKEPLKFLNNFVKDAARLRIARSPFCLVKSTIAIGLLP